MGLIFSPNLATMTHHPELPMCKGCLPKQGQNLVLHALAHDRYKVLDAWQNSTREEHLPLTF